MLSLFFKKSTALSVPRAVALARTFSSHAADAPAATLRGEHPANPVTSPLAAPCSDPPGAPTVEPPVAPAPPTVEPPVVPGSDFPAADQAVKPPVAPTPGGPPHAPDDEVSRESRRFPDHPIYNPPPPPPPRP